MTLSRDETATAYARHQALHEARRWTDLADLFRVEGTYEEPFFGRIAGREAVREFLRVSMRGLDEWTFPIQWVVVGEGRVVTQWFNRLPKLRRDGSPFQFTGITNLLYDDDGMIVSQEDTYDRVAAARVLSEAQSSVLERFNGAVIRAGSPVVALAKRLSGYG